MLSDLLRKERKWKGPCKLGVQFSIRSFGISTRSHLVHIHPFCPGLPPGWVSSHIRFPFSRRSFRPFGLSFSSPSSRLLPSSSVVPCALTINQACQFVMAILCVHLGRAVQTPQPTLSSLLPSSRPLCPLRPARRGVRSPRHSISGQLVEEDGGWREGDSSPLSLSPSLLPRSSIPIPLSFPPRRWLDTSPLVNVPAATDGISVDGEKEKEPPSSLSSSSSSERFHSLPHLPWPCLVVHLVVR